MIGYGIGAIEIGLYFFVSFVMKKLCVPFHNINNIAYYWLSMTILTGIWETSYIVNYNEITDMARTMIDNNTHAWTTQYDLTYVNPWKLAKIFYAEYGAWADREYMSQTDVWSHTIEGTHLIFCALFSFFGFVSRFDKKSVKSLIVVGMAMALQLMNSILYMVQYVRNLEMSKQIPERLHGKLTFDACRARQLVDIGLSKDRDFLTEGESKELLTSYGLPVSPIKVATTPETAAQLAQEIGFPLAMKIVSPDITHKTEVNGIRLDLRSQAEVAGAYEEILSSAASHRPDALIEGVSLQPYIPRADYELLLGAKRDENFGPVLVFGLGGIFTEIVKDRSIGLPPMNRLLARRLMQETKAYALLSGYRSCSPAHMEKLEEMIIRLSQLLIDFPEVKEIDLNPVVVKKGQPIAVDARVSLHPCLTAPPLHLVISPYPSRYEHRAIARNGLDLLIRPIRPEDGSLFTSLFDRLSAASIYLRFCRRLKALSPEMLARMTQIDYDREMALVAIGTSQDQETMFGAARIINDPDGKQAEFSVMVADDQQGNGIGAILLKKLITIGRERGLEVIWGYMLRENTSMLRLGKKVGFSAKYDTDVEMYVLTIDLKLTASA